MEYRNEHASLRVEKVKECHVRLIHDYFKTKRKYVRNYYIPETGGVVREMETNNTMCNLLRTYGTVLEAADTEDLLGIICAEYRLCCEMESRKNERKMRTRAG